MYSDLPGKTLSDYLHLQKTKVRVQESTGRLNVELLAVAGKLHSARLSGNDLQLAFATTPCTPTPK